jgi:hypothetical protein
MTQLLIVIDGEVKKVTEVHNRGYKVLELDDKTEWYVFEDSDTAGKAAREYWEDMAANDPREFTCMVGEETLISWGMGRYAGPGSTQVTNLNDWLDLWLTTPEEHFATYDGSECTCRMSKALMEELDFDGFISEKHEFVCYRHN